MVINWLNSIVILVTRNICELDKRLQIKFRLSHASKKFISIGKELSSAFHKNVFVYQAL